MAIFIDRNMAPLRYTAKFDPFLSLEGKDGIKFYHLATLLREGSQRRNMNGPRVFARTRHKMVLNERAAHRVRAEVARLRRKFHASPEAESPPADGGDGDATTVTLLCVSACAASSSSARASE